MENPRQLTFVLRVATDGEHVGLERGLNFWVAEVEDLAIVPEHVDLFDALDDVDGQFLEGDLQLLVVG